MSEPAAVGANVLELHTYVWEDAQVVKCLGRLTAEHSSELKRHVQSVLPGAIRVILDLSGVTRMDSSGLGAIVALYVSARKSNCLLEVVNYNKSIRDLLGLTNLLSVFEQCAQSGTRLP